MLVVLYCNVAVVHIDLFRICQRGQPYSGYNVAALLNKNNLRGVA